MPVVMLGEYDGARAESKATTSLPSCCPFLWDRQWNTLNVAVLHMESNPSNPQNFRTHSKVGSLTSNQVVRMSMSVHGMP